MHLPITREPHSIQDCATRAVAAHRALIAASRETLSDLPMVDRVELARFLAELDRRGCLEPDGLGTADAVIAGLRAAIARAGWARCRVGRSRATGIASAARRQGAGSTSSSTRSAGSSGRRRPSPSGSRRKHSWRNSAGPLSASARRVTGPEAVSSEMAGRSAAVRRAGPGHLGAARTAEMFFAVAAGPPDEPSAEGNENSILLRGGVSFQKSPPPPRTPPDPEHRRTEFGGDRPGHDQDPPARGTRPDVTRAAPGRGSWARPGERRQRR